MKGRVYFIGAGPGDPELLTLKAQRILRSADYVLYADSLVHPTITRFTRSGAVVEGSSGLHLEQIVERIVAAVREGKMVARVHSGDPALYGALFEQMARLEEAGVPQEIVPGVSSVFAAAAKLGVELTVPEVVQTVIFTRAEGRTPMPAGERLRDLARHQATLVLFLGIAHLRKVVDELRAGGYPAETPVAVAYKVTWEDEQIIRGTLADIESKVREAGFKKQALILVGRALDPALKRTAPAASHLYDRTFSHMFRKGDARGVGKGRGEGMGGATPDSPLPLAIVTRTRPGTRLAARLCRAFERSTLYAPTEFASEVELSRSQGPSPLTLHPYTGSVLSLLRDLFPRCTALVCVLPLGIVVRAIGGLAADKHADPAVVVMDEAGKFAISVLAGHAGGANELARRLATITDGQVVITTAAETHGLLAVDLLGKESGWIIANPENVTPVSAAVVNGDVVGVWHEAGTPERAGGCSSLFALSPHVRRVDALEELLDDTHRAALVITHRSFESLPAPLRAKAVVYHPSCLVAGIGCTRGASAEEIEVAVRRTLTEQGLAFASLRKLASIDLKREEAGLIAFARKYGMAIEFFSPEQLNQLPVPTPSAAAFDAVGAWGVAEPAALLSAGSETPLVKKAKVGRVTVAIANTCMTAR